MKNSILLICLSFVLIQCKKKDTEDPTVSNFTVNGLNTLVSVSNGDNLDIQASVSDNGEISQIRLQILKNFSVSTTDTFSIVPFSYVEIFDTIIENPFTFTEQIQVPTNATAGLYTVKLSVLDEGANVFDSELIDLLVMRTDAPQISISSPDFTSIPHYVVGDTVKLFGQVTDNYNLRYFYSNLYPENETDAVFSQTNSLDTAIISAWSFDNYIKIPIVDSLVSGTYDLELKANDNYGNLTIVSNQIIID